MVYATVMFFLVFVLPLSIFLVWLMRQQKHKKMAIIGMVVVGVLVVGAIVYTYVQAERQKQGYVQDQVGK